MTAIVSLYVSFCVLIMLALYFQRAQSGLRWEIRPVTILVFAYWLYSSALPMSVFFFGHSVGTEELTFMTAVNLGAAGYVVGAFWYRRRPEGRCAPAIPPRVPQELRVNAARVSVIVVTLCVLVFMLRFLVAAGFQIGNLFTYYGYEAIAGTTSSVLEILGGPVALAFSLVGLIISLRARRVVTSYILTLLAFVSVVYTVRGMRLWAMMTMLPAVIIVCRGRKVRLFVLVGTACAAFLLIQLVGAIRDAGFAEVQNVHIGSATFDPVGNEFGTSYQVFSLCNEFGIFEHKRWGATYTTEAALVCVPHVIWPNRPEGLAIELALVATGQVSREDLTLAYGFSNLAEAVVNFGLPGIPFVFFVLYALVVGLSNLLINRGVWGYAGYAMLGSIAVLVNRMDTTMVLKVYAVLLFSAYLGDFVTRMGIPRLQLAAAPQRVPQARKVRK
jgi:hypothetical protein